MGGTSLLAGVAATVEPVHVQRTWKVPRYYLIHLNNFRYLVVSFEIEVSV